MKFSHPYEIKSLLQQYVDNSIAYTLVGDPTTKTTGLNDYEVVLPDEITWVDFEGLYNKVFKTKANVIVIDQMPKVMPENKVLILTSSPLALFDNLAKNYNAQHTTKSSFLNRLIGKKQYTLGHNVKIGEGTRIGNNVSSGNNVTIYPNVVIYDNVIIGNNVVIHANSVIGAEPFAHIKQADRSYQKRQSWGKVIILDDVEMGACCTVDRGITETTIVGKGCKMDDHVHIGHDTWIGSNCYFSAQVAIGGYVRMKNNCVFWGKAGVISSLNIEESTVVLAHSIVMKDVKEKNQTLVGYPAENSSEYWKRMAILKQICKKQGE